MLNLFRPKFTTIGEPTVETTNQSIKEQEKNTHHQWTPVQRTAGRLRWRGYHKLINRWHVSKLDRSLHCLIRQLSAVSVKLTTNIQVRKSCVASSPDRRVTNHRKRQRMTTELFRVGSFAIFIVINTAAYSGQLFLDAWRRAGKSPGEMHDAWTKRKQDTWQVGEMGGGGATCAATHLW